MKQCLGEGWEYDSKKKEFRKTLWDDVRVFTNMRVFAKPTREHKDYSLVVVFGADYANKRRKIRAAAENAKTPCPHGIQLEIPASKKIVEGGSAVWCRFRSPYKTEADWYAGCQQVANVVKIFLDWLSKAVA